MLFRSKLSECMKPGYPPIFWESGAGSATGNYIWIWYQSRECCIDPEEVCTSAARLGNPLLRVACARINRQPSGMRPAFPRGPVTIDLRLAG